MPGAAVASARRSLFELLHQLKTIPEVVEHIDSNTAAIPSPSFPGAVATRRPSLTVTHLIEVRDHRRREATGTQARADAFLLAAERLGVEPSACLVFEDTDLASGSTAAGMAPCAFFTHEPPARQISGNQ